MSSSYCPDTCEIKQHEKEEQLKGNPSCCAWYLDNVKFGDKKVTECPSFVSIHNRGDTENEDSNGNTGTDSSIPDLDSADISR